MAVRGKHCKQLTAYTKKQSARDACKCFSWESICSRDLDIQTREQVVSPLEERLLCIEKERGRDLYCAGMVKIRSQSCGKGVLLNLPTWGPFVFPDRLLLAACWSLSKAVAAVLSKVFVSPVVSVMI